jgi:hypothetical protein
VPPDTLITSLLTFQALLIGFSGVMICVIVEAAMIGAFVEGGSVSLAGQKVAIVAIMMYVTPIRIH